MESLSFRTQSYIVGTHPSPRIRSRWVLTIPSTNQSTQLAPLSCKKFTQPSSSHSFTIFFLQLLKKQKYKNCFFFAFDDAWRDSFGFHISKSAWNYTASTHSLGSKPQKLERHFQLFKVCDVYVGYTKRAACCCLFLYYLNQFFFSFPLYFHWIYFFFGFWRVFVFVVYSRSDRHGYHDHQDLQEGCGDHPHPQHAVQLNSSSDWHNTTTPLSFTTNPSISPPVTFLSSCTQTHTSYYTFPFHL
jgi:hypothetical protein